MKTKRIFFWAGYIILIGFLGWWLIVTIIKSRSGISQNTSSQKIDLQNTSSQNINAQNIGTPAKVTFQDQILGPVDAPVTLIEYGDFECQICSEYAAIVERLAKEFTTNLCIVFRHYPLPQHSNAMIAAAASEVVAKYGKFWNMYKILNANQASWSGLPEQELRTLLADYAVKLGLDEQQFLRDLNNPAVYQKIEKDRFDAVSIRIHSTPSFFINGRSIPLPRGYEQFKAVIDAAVHNRDLTQ
jgi:protein-disulfide isomerase